MLKDEFNQSQIRFHLSKIQQLKKEYEARKTAGERRIHNEEEELKSNLQRLQSQIDLHQLKINGLQLDWKSST
jgi:hypothetical protein